YLPNTDADRKAMLEAIGVDSIDQLFAMVPGEVRMKRGLELPPALGELALSQHMQQLAGRNTPATQAACFLGGGCYDHWIPAVVDFVASRSEFYTSYTPYQAEASQGNLQALFEYQTLITQLTGMDVSNSSLYDGGSATAEAVTMALHATGRRGRVVTTAGVHPEYRRTVQTYLANFETEVTTLPVGDGKMAIDQLSAAVDHQTCCVLVQHPNFFGCLEDVAAAADVAHRAGALLVVVFDPISLGLLKRPADCGADIAVAEGQSLGNPMAYGGPYLGILACREQFVRRMPGRLVGQTVDRKGKRCWVLTLQTREQHIRRDKATSNICTNQALFALRASVYLALMGPHGLGETADLCLQKTRYAIDRLTANGKVHVAFSQPVFKEFVLRLPSGGVQRAIDSALDAGIFAGVPLGPWYPDLEDCLLVAVTEKRTKDEIDRLAKAIGEAV
ncbi:MAG: aminomethyl-transferring glycine dehydrogenase subunit GcvPA, partial [Planctomycetota bacterium]